MEEATQQNQELPSLDVIYNLALVRLDAQSRDADSILARVGPVWSVAGIFIGITIGFIFAHGAPIPLVAIISSALSALTFIAILTLGIMAYRYLGLRYPNVRAIWEEALSWNPDITKREIAKIAVPAIEFNKELIERRITYTTFALYLLPLEIALAALAITSTYFSG